MKNRSSKLAQDFTGISTKKIEQIISDRRNKTYSNGYANTKLLEPVPNYHKGAGEIVNFEYTGNRAAANNCWVILGRDRVDLPDTGYGGAGHTQSAAIYICAGMSGAEPYEQTPPAPKDRDPTTGFPKDMVGETFKSPEKMATERSFHNDASFIYLSQKCDIDTYLSLGGVSVESSENKDNYSEAATKTFRGLLGMTKYNTKHAEAPHAAVAIKSDNVRLVGRESIRLQIFSERSPSTGGDRQRSHGISLVGGGKASETQPMVLGYNLISSYRHIKMTLEALAKAFKQFVTDQSTINQVLSNHTHVNGP